jgi:hypothetical protein
MVDKYLIYLSIKLKFYREVFLNIVIIVVMPNFFID